MPKSFYQCARAGGRVRRVSGPSSRWGLSRGQYLNICIDKRGRVHRGYVKRKQGSKNR